jgi:type IV pilus assembly protein PilE
MHKLSITNQAGMTLIELLVVITVIAILAAIALPNYSDYIKRARRADAMQGLENVRLLQEKWRRNDTNYGTTAEIRNDGNTTGDWLSLEGYYALSVTANTTTEFTAIAERRGKQADDTCGTFRVNQDGPVYGSPPDYADQDCWRD